MFHKKIGRVHWFLWHLSPIVKNNYKITYNYASHSYCLLRTHIIKPFEIYIVVRSSKRCFRLMYNNFITNDIFYKSFKTSKECADFILEKYVGIPP